MFISFKELEDILKHWKMHSLLHPKDTVKQNQLKERMIKDVTHLFKHITPQDISVEENVILQRNTKNFIYRDSINVTLKNNSKL